LFHVKQYRRGCLPTNAMRAPHEVYAVLEWGDKSKKPANCLLTLAAWGARQQVSNPQ
jgi:hypothetical protein